MDAGITSKEFLDMVSGYVGAQIKAAFEKDKYAPFSLDASNLVNVSELSKYADASDGIIAGTIPGECMSFADADTFRVNPHFGETDGYGINCQSCVVVFEARQRGYNVEVLPNTPGSALSVLSSDPSLAWIDPLTGEHPQYIYDETKVTPQSFVNFMDSVVEQGRRYTVQFMWYGFNHGGHIINLDRNDNGVLRLKDNQPDSSVETVHEGIEAITDYFNRVGFTDEYGNPVEVPKILRIDNMLFDPIVNNVMKRC